jgi:membrane protein YdbS with pleckstrin-like domain
MRDATIDMWETLFILLSLFAVVVTAMSPYFVWLLALALGIQLFDFVSTPDRWIDFIILVFLALVALPALGIYTVLAPYESWLLFFALLAQLYDDYTS